jgi:hypothetical protein
VLSPLIANTSRRVNRGFSGEVTDMGSASVIHFGVKVKTDTDYDYFSSGQQPQIFRGVNRE